MMIGWDILNKDNSFSFFSNYFVRSALFVFPIVCPPFVSANLAPSIFFARPCPFSVVSGLVFPFGLPSCRLPFCTLKSSNSFHLAFPFPPAPNSSFPFLPARIAVPPFFSGPLRPFRPLRPLRPLRLPRLPRLPRSPRPSLSRLFFSARPAPLSCHPLSAPFCSLCPFFRSASPHFLPRAGGGLRARLTIGNKFPAIAFLFC